MNPIDNVERRDSDPHAHMRKFPDHGPDVYQEHVNDVCRAIHQMPPELADEAYFIQVLETLATKAMYAHHAKIAETLDLVSFE